MRRLLVAAAAALIMLVAASSPYAAGSYTFYPNDSGWPPCSSWADTGNFKLVYVDTPWGLEVWGYACVSPYNWQRVW